MADTNLALSRLRGLATNVEREKSGTDEPYTLRQATNVLRQFAENFADLDTEIQASGRLPADWEVIVFAE